MHYDLMCQHPGSLDTTVCGPHQSDSNPTLDVSARPWVYLLTLCCEAADYPLQHPVNHQQNQQRAKSISVAGGRPQVTSFLCFMCILKKTIWCLQKIGFYVSVPNMIVVNTFDPFLPDVMDQKVVLMSCGLWILFWLGGFRSFCLSLCNFHHTTFVEEGVVAHVRGRIGFTR